MATNWEAIRAEYVSSKISIITLATKHNVSENALEKRASKEKWAEARRKVAEKVISRFEDKVTEIRADELAKFNSDDLKMARAIRAKAARMLDGCSTPSALRSLAGAVETAQRIGRLALGASTENTAVVTQEDLLREIEAKLPN